MKDVDSISAPLHTPPPKGYYNSTVVELHPHAWWRNRTNTALHSFHNGTSRLEPLAGYLIPIINAVTTPIVWLYVLLIPKKQRATTSVPKLINDRTAFTNTILEPLLVFFLAKKLTGIVSLWLFISVVALAIHATWREIAKLNKVLDFRDSVLDAKVMMELHQKSLPDKAQHQMMQQVAISIRETPQITAQLDDQYPDLMHIIEEMNRDKTHLSA